MINTITASTLEQWLDDSGELALFDVREHGQFGEGHLFFAASLPYSRLEPEAAKLAPNPSVRVVVYDAGEGVAQRAARRLRQLGYSAVHVLAGGAQAWAAAGYTLFQGVNLPSKTFGEWVETRRATPHLSADELARRQAAGDPLIVLDGRPFEEYRQMSIPGSICCPNGELGVRVDALVADRATTIVINCAGRTRSIIGAQTLIDLGIANPVLALENGTQGWMLADRPLEHGQQRRYPDALHADNARVRAAERLAARAGAAWIGARDIRQWRQKNHTVFLLDVRTAEEFASGSLPGARHAPGGQLQQATDQYLGVRNAKVVLFDNDGVRAPVTASWLRQLGHQAFVLKGGLAQGLADGVSLPRPQPVGVPAWPTVSARELAGELDRGQPVEILDLRASQHYRNGHIPGSRWSIRPLLDRLPAAGPAKIVLLAEDAALAAWAAADIPAPLQARVYLLAGGFAAWRDGGLPVAVTPDAPADAERIDYLFFTHDRHAGNKDAARQYLAWEQGLWDRLHARERAVFKPLPGE
ncbi:rhodanese-like domain-containing protein [Sodalis sp. RH22]|uniref:rhodanese-like domain-containing protein n=1 Tax=unclassified Sodalis (in: enterobacteria) TaxID=2636512 RepID=UPI0039B6E71E